MKSKNGTWDAGTKEGNVGQTFLWELPSLLCSRKQILSSFLLPLYYSLTKIVYILEKNFLFKK